ncbi:hypothetical protein Vqi01_57480 [Micromonospora qiuiae]|uniref:Uncharacterized protein n=1 Tax=Micromonospora qiuiae TaxID=502268 RepID=A0ABQ4JJ00_9ACTN|nr:hypothetical protein Vqi01_57480 [Micromonospora qiuiae]
MHHAKGCQVRADNGRLLWGSDQTEGEYYWLVDRSVEPDRWPMVARWDGIEPWQQLDMSLPGLSRRAVASGLVTVRVGEGPLVSEPAAHQNAMRSGCRQSKSRGQFPCRHARPPCRVCLGRCLKDVS